MMTKCERKIQRYNIDRMAEGMHYEVIKIVMKLVVKLCLTYKTTYKLHAALLIPKDATMFAEELYANAKKRKTYALLLASAVSTSHLAVENQVMHVQD